MSRFDAIHEVPVPLANAPVHKVVVPDPDIHIFSIYHPGHVDFITTPLANQDEIAAGHHSHPHHGPSHDSDSASSDDDEKAKHADEPVLKTAHEAPTIQLFFDLYFVANLTTFSAQHDIHSANELRSYIGYFAMIWFTWFQNTMFDVRFSNDSVFERFCKAAQFGIMTGFAITGPGYQTGFEPGSDAAILAVSAFRTLSFILMTSRLILTFQYSVALFWLKGYKSAWLPMIGHIAIEFIAAMIFLGLSFAFSQEQSETVLVGWYITFVVEAWAIALISGNTPFLSFRHTHLVERLGLLTLIILGEGIISMSNALNTTGTDNSYSSPIIGQIICCVVVVYLMYMLYFDNVNPSRMGNLRQHIWAILHFPLHASFVLVEEAQAQLAIWQKVLDVQRPVVDAINSVSTLHPTSEQIQALSDRITDIIGRFLTLSSVTASNLIQPEDSTEYFNILRNSTSNESAVKEALDHIEGNTLNYIAGKFNIKVEAEGAIGQELVNAIFDLYQVVYVYYFAFAGLVLIVLSVLFWIGKRDKLRGEVLAVILRFSAGLGLALLSTFAAPGNLDQSGDGNDNLHRFMYSAMPSPTVLIVYLLVLILDNILIRYVKSVVTWRLHLHHHKNIPNVERPDLAAQDAPEAGTAVTEKKEGSVKSLKQNGEAEQPKSPVRAQAQERDGSSVSEM